MSAMAAIIWPLVPIPEGEFLESHYAARRQTVLADGPALELTPIEHVLEFRCSELSVYPSGFSPV